MNRQIRQGDILLERVEDIQHLNRLLKISEDQANAKAWGYADATEIKPEDDGSLVLAKGERSGHKHAVHGGKARFYHDSGLSDGIEDNSLYLGHLVVSNQDAVLRHEEHAPITLDKGVYRVRRQREHHPSVNYHVAD